MNDKRQYRMKVRIQYNVFKYRGIIFIDFSSACLATSKRGNHSYSFKQNLGEAITTSDQSEPKQPEIKSCEEIHKPVSLEETIELQPSLVDIHQIEMTSDDDEQQTSVQNEG